MPDQDRIVVVVAAGHAIEQVADRLRATGMRVDQVLAPIGVITGAVAPGTRAAVDALAGVVSVEPDGTVGLPPGPRRPQPQRPEPHRPGPWGPGARRPGPSTR